MQRIPCGILGSAEGISGFYSVIKQHIFGSPNQGTLGFSSNAGLLGYQAASRASIPVICIEN
jgi:hypothetical protein